MKSTKNLIFSYVIIPSIKLGGIYREQNPIKSSDNAFFMKLTDTTLAYHSKMNQGRGIYLFQLILVHLVYTYINL